MVIRTAFLLWAKAEGAICGEKTMHEVLHRMQKQAMINTIHQVYPMRLGGSLQATATMLGRKAGTMTDLFELERA